MTGRDDEHREPPATSGSLTELTSQSNVVYQAAGFVSAALHVPVDAALTVLLDEARATDVELAALARDVIARLRPVPTPRDGTAPPDGSTPLDDPAPRPE